MSERPERGSGALGHPTEPDSNLGLITPEPCDRGGVTELLFLCESESREVSRGRPVRPGDAAQGARGLAFCRHATKAGQGRQGRRAGLVEERSAEGGFRLLLPPHCLPPGVEPKVEMEGEQ